MSKKYSIENELSNVFVISNKLKRKLDAQLEAEMHWQGYKAFKISYLPVFLILYNTPNTAINIAQYCGISKQATSKLIKEMMLNGFIKTQLNKQDARSTLLLLTAHGKRTATSLRKCLKNLAENYKSLIGINKFENMCDNMETLLILHEE